MNDIYRTIALLLAHRHFVRALGPYWTNKGKRSVMDDVSSDRFQKYFLLGGGDSGLLTPSPPPKTLA